MLAQLLRKNANRIPAGLLRRLANLWPPFWGAGITIHYVSPDYRELEVRLKLRWYNSNYVGTHFGGSIYAMTDPFYMMMLINILGSNYIVWDKGAKINFIKPGRSELSAHFTLDEVQLQEIKKKVDEGGKYVFDLPVEIKDMSNEVIASVIKTLYVRKKRAV